jgi:hypothetical protein
VGIESEAFDGNPGGEGAVVVRFSVFGLLLLVGLWTLSAEADSGIPVSAEPLTKDQIESYLNGRIFRFEVFGEDKPLSGTSTWDLDRGVVYGTYLWNNAKEGRWRWVWYLDGDLNCTKPFLREAVCRRAYLHGESFIQVKEDGAVDAILTPVD